MESNLGSGIPFLMGITYIVLMTVLPALDIGRAYPAGVYQWYLPVVGFVVTGFPFIIGYFAGWINGSR